jgi:hypothetical protein
MSQERLANGLPRTKSQEESHNCPRQTMSEHMTPRTQLDGKPMKWREQRVGFTTEHKTLRFLEPDERAAFPRVTRGTTVSKRFRKMLLLVALLMATSFWAWVWYVRPQTFDDSVLQSQEESVAHTQGTHFDGTRIQDLDISLLPGGDLDPSGRRRLIFVGDIHGCAHELKKLMKEVDFNEELDHLIAVGDVISKGPDNTGVLDELIRLGASSVRGNHEDRILDIAPSDVESSDADADMPVDVMGKKAKDKKLLRRLSKKHLKYLQSLPLMLRIPPLPQAADPSHKDRSPLAEEIVVVHAGLVPGVALDKQDPYYVMNMRSIKTKNHHPLAEAKAKDGKSKPW